jgi:hypothetical protein
MKVDKKYIWDYDTASIDLSKPAVLRWYISRKIDFGDWKSLDSELVEKNLRYLAIDSTLKLMLKSYYASKRTRDNS